MTKLTAKDFATNQEIRWCPGCGDYAILKALKTTFVEVSKQKHEIAIVSGIGCAARMPYYLDVYGLHTIHGRAIPIAQGLKTSLDNLDVWVISGDGDLLSIGLAHLIHGIRHNLDLQIVLLNNEIYGLTKGQFSPTSRLGTISSTSLSGSTVQPLNAIATSLTAGAGFIARGIDILHDPLVEVLVSAQSYAGTSFVEILQNCPVYNKGVYDNYTDIKTRDENLIYLKDNEKMFFGSNLEYGLKLSDEGLIVTDASDKSIATHEVSNKIMAFHLANLTTPMPLGVIYQNNKLAQQNLSKTKVSLGKKDKILEIEKLYK